MKTINRYKRLIIYNRMLYGIGRYAVKYRSIGLCGVFRVYCKIDDPNLREYIDQLPELKQACKEHPTFIGFDKYHWFDCNLVSRTPYEFNNIREQVIREALYLISKKSVWRRLIEFVKLRRRFF